MAPTPRHSEGRSRLLRSPTVNFACGLIVGAAIALLGVLWLRPARGSGELGSVAIAVALMTAAVGLAQVARWVSNRAQPGRGRGRSSAGVKPADMEHRRELVARQARVQELLDHPDRMSTLFQPIVDLSSGAVAGVEALTRFASDPPRPPNEWFADAASVGLRIPLELAALRMALDQIDLLPPGYLAINLSPAAVISAEFAAMLGDRRLAFERTIVELTEPVSAEHYQQLVAVLERLRTAGARVAVDDGGSGYTNLRQILDLRPDFVKLDRSFVSGAHHDPARRALVHAVVQFAADIGAAVIAEGVEDHDELRTVRTAGIWLAQGYLFGRPARPPLQIDWEPAESQPLRALIVDDDAIVRALIARIVRRAGIIVAGQAGDGQEALRQAAELRPDVILLDLGMPIMSGEEALPTLRRQLPHAHILVLSANQQEASDQATSLRGLGADRHIPKDLVVKHLPSILTKIVTSSGAAKAPRPRPAQSPSRDDDQLAVSGDGGRG